MSKELLQQALDVKVAELMKAADGYAHVYAFVSDDTMPKMRAALEADIRAAIAQPVQPTNSDSIEIDLKQATELLEMFGGEPTTLTLIAGKGHSGTGLYAYYTEIPEEGFEYLGEADDEAVPEIKVAQPVPNVKLDGDQWCATWPDFINLQESSAGFGNTPELAISALREAIVQPVQPAYDQTALELCAVCGWKTLIPDDICLNCEHEKTQSAQPATETELAALRQVAIIAGQVLRDMQAQDLMIAWQTVLEEAIDQVAQPAPVAQAEPLSAGWTDEQISKAARALSDQCADTCGIDKEEHWTDYKQGWIDDARAILEAVTITPIGAQE